MKFIIYFSLCVSLLVGCSSMLSRQESHQAVQKAAPAQYQFDSRLSSYEYPYPVQVHKLMRQGQNLEMAYMDIQPPGPHKGTFVLLHGKNFSGFYFKDIIHLLKQNGYRVIVPDQIGFGKSTKPEAFQYSFHALAESTQDLLTTLNVKNISLVGHSMGGMLATRYALMYPQQVRKLYLINPIGFEDYKTMTGYRNFDALFADELNNSPEKIKGYQQQAYYDGAWKEEYEKLIIPALGWIHGPDKGLLAKTAALTTEMIYTQPVRYEFKNLKMPVELIIGQRDRTAIGRAWAPKEMQPKMGDYPKLSKMISKEIPKGTLHSLNQLGHVPFIEDFTAFQKVFKMD